MVTQTPRAATALLQGLVSPIECFCNATTDMNVWHNRDITLDKVILLHTLELQKKKKPQQKAILWKACIQFFVLHRAANDKHYWAGKN